MNPQKSDPGFCRVLRDCCASCAYFVGGGAGIFILILFPQIVFAEIPESLAVKTIIGESANQGFDGMTAVGEVIRNRGSLKGLYGQKRDISHEPAWVVQSATQAWKRSETSNLTQKATHFENIRSFGTPYWAKSMQKTVVIKDHTFYKESR